MSTTTSQDERRERRSQTRALAHKLVTERTQMLVLYCRAAGLGTEKETESAGEVVEKFCQVLVDYIAAGHFTLYERITSGKERRHNVREIAEQTYPTIALTTEQVVEFNDKYEDRRRAENKAELMKDLSELGEQLAIRVELEDRLLNAMN
ncbi:MAG: sigma D regulator [Gammaproteobacteria bacterium]|nr:sigma D regulator [Gammaproteobacteria bacterium]